MLTHPDPSKIPYGEHFSWANLSQIFAKIAEDGVVKTLLVFAAFAFHWAFDSHVEALIAITILIFLDTLSGAIRAYKDKKFSSSGFFRFALKCTVYFILLATAALTDKAMPTAFASVIMTTFLATTEAISIMENLAALGFKVPSSLLKRLRFLKGSDNIEK